MNIDLSEYRHAPVENSQHAGRSTAVILFYLSAFVGSDFHYRPIQPVTYFVSVTAFVKRLWKTFLKKGLMALRKNGLMTLIKATLTFLLDIVAGVAVGVALLDVLPVLAAALAAGVAGVAVDSLLELLSCDGYESLFQK